MPRQLLYNMAVSAHESSSVEADTDATDKKLDKRKKKKKKQNPDKAAPNDSTAEGGSPVVLAEPYVNVSLQGTVPTEAVTFALFLPCTGAASAEVDVNLRINVSSSRPNLPPTQLNFKRRKICLAGNGLLSHIPYVFLLLLY